MAEPPAAPEKLPPTGISVVAGEGFGADAGQPVSEVPPLVEFGDPFDAAESEPPAVAATAQAELPPDPSAAAVVLPDPPTAPILAVSPAASQRPPRRSFLAPAPTEAVSAREAPPPRARPSRPPARLRPMAATGPPAPVRWDASAPGQPARPRRWRRRLGVGAGVAAALALAVAAQIGASGDWIDRLRLAALEFLPGPKPPPGTADAPAAPSPRVLEETGRAKAGDAEAQLSLAILYAKGEGVAQDYAVAARWFRAAAERGLMRAQYDLGVLYERGRGVPLDYPQAVTWYRKAAEQTHPLAQYNLAVAHTKGQGVRQNFFEAALWYHRAAAQGVVAAMVNLAILYERGEGVESSTVDAYSWYRAAARRGSQPAARRAEELLQAFSPLEQTRAEAKTLDINASIRDAIGESSRLANRKPAAATTGEGGPVLKSGLESGRSSRGAARAENP